ncbi:thermonuclease family protein [Pontibacter chitinilyticus]|uniref:thermonuclease family protein n=1 Tax=Pontibacter chitinilyticus TaxID=2674989 RepID=UPI003219BD53
MKRLFILFLLLSTCFTFACKQNHEQAREEFRKRQQAIQERAAEAPATATPAPAAERDDTTATPPAEKASQKPASTAGDKVVGVKDGDTIVLLRNGEEETVRLYGVDTPEKTQAYGQKAKQFTSDMVFGKTVQLIVKNKDRYGRTVGTIILADGRSLNAELVRNGYAWHYTAYSKDKNLANLEADARRFKRGLWQDPNPTPPWDYRKVKRSGSNTAAATASTSAAPLPAGATKRMVYLCNSGSATVYYYKKDCANLQHCKEKVVTVTEAAAIREYHRRADKSCGQ